MILIDFTQYTKILMEHGPPWTIFCSLRINWRFQYFSTHALETKTKTILTVTLTAQKAVSTLE
jgi:hypothetical protein